MKVWISTDLEGISGVCIFEQTRERGLLYQEARRLLMGDISAAVEGVLGRRGRSSVRRGRAWRRL